MAKTSGTLAMPTQAFGRPVVVSTYSDEPALQLTVAAPVKKTEPDTSYGTKPRNGLFLVVAVTAEGLADDADDADIASSDFQVVDVDGAVYEQGLSATPMALNYTRLEPKTLNKGETTKGAVAFDVPNKPGMALTFHKDAKTLAMWNIG